MNRRRFHFAVAAVLLALWIWSPPADEVSVAYVGPGAGFAFLGSLLALVAGFLLSLASLLLWPFRVLRASIRRRRAFRHARVRKLIFLGLDGLDHGLTERYLKEGKLPNLARLREQGSFSPLRTTFPSLSPVAALTRAAVPLRCSGSFGTMFHVRRNLRPASIALRTGSAFRSSKARRRQ